MWRYASYMRTSFVAAIMLLSACVSATPRMAAADPAPPRAAHTTLPATNDPQAIFGAARRAWASTSYPRYANYSVGVRYRNGATTVVRHYDTLEDLRRDIVFARTFSREETANPSFPPHGINIGVMAMTLNAAQLDDPVGPLALAITYDFGILLVGRTTQIAQLGSQITAPERYQIIGRTGTTAPTYDVQLIELLDAGATYHLRLTPLRDPQRYRLREMWIDAATSITRKIVVAGNFGRDPYDKVNWEIRFRQIDGGPYISEERAQGALDFGAAGSLDDVTITFDDLQSTSALPLYGTVGINGGAPDFVSEP